MSEMVAQGVRDFSEGIQPEIELRSPRDGARVMLYCQKYKEGTNGLFWLW